MSQFTLRSGWRAPLLTAFLTTLGLATQAQTVDGTRGGAEGYGTALAVQTNTTGFGNSTSGNSFTAGGSELDNIHAQVVGSDLFIFIGGNLESNGNKMDLFIDSKSTGGQNVVLSGNNGPAGPYTGMTFDTGFAPDYALGFNFNGGNLEVGYSIIGIAGSNNIGQTNLGATAFNIDFDLTAGVNNGQVAIDNSNTAGVDGAGIAGAAAVDKGFEIRIPLSAINPDGNIKLMALINNGSRDYLSNQTIAGLPLTTGNLGSNGSGAGLGNLTAINFNNAAYAAGNQFVTLAYTPPTLESDMTFSVSSLKFGSVLTTAGTAARTFVITNTGTAPLSITSIGSTSAAFVASPQTVTNLAVSGTQIITVTFDPSSPGLQTATLTVNSNAPTPTNSILAVQGIGTAPGTAIIDGTRDATYPAALAVQGLPTQFGNTTTGDVLTASGGSELDNIHAQIIGTDLYLFIGGNIENSGDANGGNRIEVLFDAKSGGQNTPSSSNVPFDGLGGKIFERNFDYHLSVQGTNTGFKYTFNNVSGTADNGATGAAGTSTGGATSGTVTFGANTGDGAVDNSNTAGVSGAAATGANLVDTGLELRIPLASLYATGQTTGPIAITAFINSGDQSFAANQFLASLASGGNLGNSFNLNPNTGATAGNQFVTVANGVAPLDADITVAPSSLIFGSVSVSGGSQAQTFSVGNAGGLALNVTSIVSSNASYTVSPTSFTVAPSGSQTVTVTFDPSIAGTQAGTLTISSNDPTNPTTPVTVTGNAVAAGLVVVDGTLDASLYGAPKALQTVPTQFGNNQSELNGAYAVVQGSDLYVHLTGNLENGGNKLMLFFDTDIAAGVQTYNGAGTQQMPAINGQNANNSTNLGGMGFDLGFTPERFIAVALNGGIGAGYTDLTANTGTGTLLTVNGAGLSKPLTFPGGAQGDLAINNTNTGGVSDVAVNNPASVTTGVELRIPLSALGTITATTPIRVMAAVVSGNYGFLSNQTLGGLPVGFGNLGGPGGTNFANFPGLQFFTARRGDVVVSAGGTLLSGDFNNVTVTGGAGVLFPAEDRFDVAVSLTVQNNAAMTVGEFGSRNITGTGTFTVQAGGNLTIGNQAGITTSGGIGAVQVTGGRSFSNDANYIYQWNNGGTGVTGSALPNTVRRLRLLTSSTPSAASTLNLSNFLSVRQLVQAGSNTTLNAGANLTLLSSATGQAMVYNEGSGVVNGGVTVQRYVDGATNTSLGYRHYSTPVTGATGAQLGTMYGAFPSLYRYNEAAVATTFDEGWNAVGAAAPLVRGVGYTLFQGSNDARTFVGSLTNGDVNVTATNTANIPTESGWNFWGNPYPSPLDADLLMASFPSGVTRAISTWKSLPSTLGGAANGQYIIRTIGAGTTDVSGATSQYLPLAQAFFVPATVASANVTMTNAMRPTTYVDIAHYRPAPGPRPRLTFGLTAVAGPQLTGVTDNLIVLFDENATTGFDNGFDAPKMRNVGEVPSIAALQNGAELAINTLGALTSRTVVPLTVTVLTAGTYKLNASEMLNMPAGTQVYLLDALTGTRQNLSRNAVYATTLDAGTQASRFTLVFEPAASPLATGAELATAAITVYPNPSHGAFRLTLPLGLTVTHATVTDNLGRTVAQPVLTGATTEISLPTLPVGVYSLHMTTSTGAVTRRVVIE